MRRTVLQNGPLQGKAGSSTTHATETCEHNNSYVQLSAKIMKLEKSNKKLKRANKKR
jgi:hypothetical protein